MSFIAVDLKVVETLAPIVARATGAPEERIGWGLVRLWHQAWTRKRAAVTRLALAGCFGPEGLDAILEALVDAELLEASDTGWRVKGADSRLRLDEARSRGGKASASNLRRGRQASGSPPAPAGEQPGDSRKSAGDVTGQPEASSGTPPTAAGQQPEGSREGAGQPKTEPAAAPVPAPAVSRLSSGSSRDSAGDQPEDSRESPSGSTPALTPTTYHLTPNYYDDVRARGVVRLVSGTPSGSPPAEPEGRHDSAGAYFAFLNAERLAAGLTPEEVHPGKAQAWFSEAMLELNGDGERLDAAVAAFARDPYWQARNLPLRGLMSQWRKYVPRAKAQAVAP